MVDPIWRSSLRESLKARGAVLDDLEERRIAARDAVPKALRLEFAIHGEEQAKRAAADLVRKKIPPEYRPILGFVVKYADEMIGEAEMHVKYIRSFGQRFLKEAIARGLMSRGDVERLGSPICIAFPDQKFYKSHSQTSSLGNRFVRRYQCRGRLHYNVMLFLPPCALHRPGNQPALWELATSAGKRLFGKFPGMFPPGNKPFVHTDIERMAGYSANWQMIWDDALRSRRPITSVEELDRYVSERVKGWKLIPSEIKKVPPKTILFKPLADFDL